MATFKDLQLWYGGVPTERKFGPLPPAFYVRPFRTATGQASGLPLANDSNSGLRPDKALKTLSAALAKCTDHAGQVVYVISGGTSAGNTTDDISSTLTISNNGIAVVGVASGSTISSRARLNQLSTATGVAPMVEVSGSNNYFEGLQFFQGVADATSIGDVLVSGDRNKFVGCHFAGIGHATMDVAGAYSLSVTGEENEFENCVIGLDTVGRGSNANSELRFDSGATRNRFKNCLFLTYADANTHQFLITTADGMDRFNYFENCIFTNAVDSAATAMTEAFDLAATTSPGGGIVLKDCTLVGATEWDAGDNGNLWIDGGPPAAATSGIAVEPAT